MKKDNLKYILYVRKSTESEDRQMNSLTDQTREMMNVANRVGIKGKNIVKVIEESRSAKKPGRSGFNEMISDIHAGKANGILCWKLNRLARNPVDGGQISWLLQQGLIQHIQTHSGDYKPSDNVLMMQVEFGMANQFIKDLSVDVRRGIRRKGERGWYPIATLPAGYRHNTGNYMEGGEEIVQDERFELVRSLWNLILTGEYTISDIMRIGKERGFINPRTHKEYSQSTYYALFSNEFYCGYFYIRNKSGERIRVHGKHVPMVTESEFNHVQILLGRRGKPTRINKLDFPFRGPLYCGECSCAITAERKHQAICTECKYKFSIKNRTDCPKCGTDMLEMKNPSIIDKTYYHCTKKRGVCTQKSVEGLSLEKQIEHELSNIEIPKEFHQWAVDVLKDLNEVESSDQKRIQMQLKKKETQLLQRINNLACMRADGEINAEQFKEMRSAAEKELDNLKKETGGLYERAIDWVDIANQYMVFAEKAKDVFRKSDFNQKRAILNTLGSNLVIKGKKLTVQGLNPLSGIKKLHDTAVIQIDRLEPKNTQVKQGYFSALDPKNPVLRRRQESNLHAR